MKSSAFTIGELAARFGLAPHVLRHWESAGLLSPSRDPMDHEDLLRRHVAVLERQIAKAQAAKSLIEHALSCPVAFADCPHAGERVAARIPRA